MHSEDWIAESLRDLRERDLLRRATVRPAAGGRFVCEGKEILNFSSNDYLDLARDPRLADAAERALRSWGTGAGSSRLVTGTLPIHEELERTVAEAKGYPAALTFGSGFLANAGIIPAVVGRSDTVYADRLVHASILDGIALSRASLRRFRHNDPEHLRELLAGSPVHGRRLIVTESVFSMDGDLAPLAEITALAAEFDAMLMVDEAHAAGVFGPSGAGLVAAGGHEAAVNLSMGTFSKALGSYGGYVACSEAMRELLVNRARAFVFTTALPPPVAAASLEALRILRREPDSGRRLRTLAAGFRERLQAGGLDTGASQSQIVPVMIGDAGRALRVAERLLADGIVGVAIRPPTVPAGTARLRLSVTLAHREADLAVAADACIRAVAATGEP